MKQKQCDVIFHFTWPSYFLIQVGERSLEKTHKTGLKQISVLSEQSWENPVRYNHNP